MPPMPQIVGGSRCKKQQIVGKSGQRSVDTRQPPRLKIRHRLVRVAAGAFGFLIFNHVFDGPDLCGASSFFETMPSRPSLQC
jgi:hypothetical protein